MTITTPKLASKKEEIIKRNNNKCDNIFLISNVTKNNKKMK